MIKSGKIIPIGTAVKPPVLFPDSLAENEIALLKIADGTRSIDALAQELSLDVKMCENLISQLIHSQYLRAATLDEVWSALATLPNVGRHNDAIALAQFVLRERRGDLAVLTTLANLYEITARPADAAAQWQFISQIHQHEHRSGEALRAARKAAALQPLTHHLQIALADLCLQANREQEAVRVFCGYARRLADNKMEQAALAALDYAARQLPNNDALMLVEAEILAGQGGKRRSRPANPQKKKFNLGGLTSFLWLWLAFVALLYAGYDYVIREQQIGVVETVDLALREAQLLSPYRRERLLNELIEKLNRAAPRFDFMTIETYHSAVFRIRALYEKAATELQNQREWHKQQLVQWQNNRIMENERIIGELLLVDDPEIIPLAQVEWREWLQQK